MWTPRGPGWGLPPGEPVWAAAAAAAAAAFSRARVSLLGRRPRTPLRTGSGGSGLGSRKEAWLERRLGLEGEKDGSGWGLVGDTGGGGTGHSRGLASPRRDRSSGGDQAEQHL